jgi:hypothetical protein
MPLAVLFIGDCFASVAVFPDQEVRWLYGTQPVVAGEKIKKFKGSSRKLQA